MRTATYLSLALLLGCHAAVHGNGTVEGSEQCDDGNAVSGDGCNVSCELEVCGDGVVNNGGLEQCDDGNQDNDDGCSSVCRKERCGDGVVNNVKEQCDDDNLDNGDGCNARCQSETCGDGIVNNNTETCDDGNRLDGDGCQSDCLLPPASKDWGFLPPARLDLAGSFVDVKLALQDLDGDKQLDLVVLDDAAPRVFSGKGDGTFSSRTPQLFMPFATGAHEMHFADFNGDGAVDVFFPQWSAGLFFGYGAPDFKRTTSMAISHVHKVSAITTADVNNDGNDDGIVAIKDSLLIVYGDAAGALNTKELSVVSFDAVAAADVNGDSFLDIAALKDDELTLFLGSKRGAFKAQKPIALSPNSRSLLTGDTNGDGLSDLIIIIGAHVDTLTYQASTKDFALRSGPSLVTKSWQPLPASICDVNNDGALDVVVLEDTRLRVLLGNSAGDFHQGFEAPVQTRSPLSALTTGDLNDDGECDIITSGLMPTVWLGNGNSKYSAPR